MEVLHVNCMSRLKMYSWIVTLVFSAVHLFVLQPILKFNIGKELLHVNVEELLWNSSTAFVYMES
jgi:hypothetical protein